MNNLFQKLYTGAPVFAQNLAISAYGYHWHRRRYGGVFSAERKAFKAREQFSKEQWREYQTIQVRKLLSHAFETVPYYSGVFKGNGISFGDINQFELTDLKKIPILEKNVLRTLGTTDLISKKRETGGAFFSSSGSTGTPLKILYSLATHQKISAAYEVRVRNWAGLTRHQGRGMIGGRRILPKGNASPPFYRYNFVEKQLYLSAYHISAHNVENYLYGIQKYKSEYMVGYAMSNYLLARFFDELGLQAPRMKAVLTSSEPLTPEMRSLMERVYQCKIYDGWSGVENCGLISENEFGQLLVSPDTGILEVLNESGEPCKPGEVGELVCTGLLNYDQPLIRYKIGDKVRLSKDQTNLCGRNMPVIESIVGRVEDVVIGPDGREMVRFHGVFVDLPHVTRGQIIQEGFSEFNVLLESSGLLTKEEITLVESRMKSQLGDRISVSVREVKEISPGPNGKFKAVISKIKRP